MAAGAPARLVAAGAAIVAGSVLADSALEHYRGSFRNPAMWAPLVTSALTIGFSIPQAIAGSERNLPVVRGTTQAAAVAAGTLGLGFHAFNVGKRPGGLAFVNLFYGAPLGAPAALVLAGMLRAAADAVATPGQRLGPVPLASGRVLAGLTALGLVGTSAEAALLHFRGAYHDPFMWVPVLLPPVAALSLARDAARASASGVTTALLGATAAIGLIGAGFHAYGVSRNMGGWRNWRQNILAGPPLPAPPAFTGLALAALGALMLMNRSDG